MTATTRPLTIAVLVKQVPRVDARRLDRDGRLARAGLELEMNPYCRRAVSQAVRLARESGGTCVAVTLGPPSAQDCLREAVAWGADSGLLVTDPAFAGSDTLATARALAAALRTLGPLDLVVCGRNSVDADTGQLPAQLAELLDLPIAAAVRELSTVGDRLDVRCELDDGSMECSLRTPALITCAERLIRPAKVDPAGRAAVPADRIRRLDAAALGPGPWGAVGSPTSVGPVRDLAVPRRRLRCDGDVDSQVRQAVAALAEAGAFDRPVSPPGGVVPDADPAAVDRLGSGGAVVVLAEPGRDRATRELLGAAARLAARGPVVAVGTEPIDPATAGGWGADLVVPVHGAVVEEDLAAAIAPWCAEVSPWAVLAPSTMWGRQVAARLAARLDAGLVADAIDLSVDADGRLVCGKPAFGGALVAAVTCRSPIQLVTVRAGVLPVGRPRVAVAALAPELTATPRGRIVPGPRVRDDDPDALAAAEVVVVAGAGVDPQDYPLLRPLLDALGAELAATRKVTDRGWQPRARQVGITGRSVAPRLFVTLGVQGTVNHVLGARAAGTVLAVNTDPAAPVFDACDVGVVADWRQVVPRLVDALTDRVLAGKPCA